MPATRLLAFDAAVLDPADAASVAHLAVCAATPWPMAGSCAIAADPLRLPFVEALFDVVIVAAILEATDAPGVFLREVRRVIAPAGRVWLVVPRRRLSLGHGVPGHHFSRARLERLLVEAMLDPVGWDSFGSWYLISAEPRGGAAVAMVGRVGAIRRVTV